MHEKMVNISSSPIKSLMMTMEQSLLQSLNPSRSGKIDSDIQSYTVNTSATIVTYLKGEEGNLYQYKLAEDSKDKVASEVEGFEVSDDGTKICYINSEGSLYLKYAGKDKEKIASEVTSLEYLTDDFKTVYYIKEGSLLSRLKAKTV